MNRDEFSKSIERIYATGDGEIDCDGLQALLPKYVDAEIDGAEPGKRYPAVYAHLAQCPDCAEEYKGLRQVARLAAQDKLPAVSETLEQFAPEEAREPGRAVPLSTHAHNR